MIYSHVGAPKRVVYETDPQIINVRVRCVQVPKGVVYETYLQIISVRVKCDGRISTVFQYRKQTIRLTDKQSSVQIVYGKSTNVSSARTASYFGIYSVFHKSSMMIIR